MQVRPQQFLRSIRVVRGAPFIRDAFALLLGWRAALIVGFSILTQGSAVLQSVALGQIVEAVGFRVGSDTVSVVGWTAALVTCLIVGPLLTFGQDACRAVLIPLLVAGVKDRLFRHFVIQGAAFFEMNAPATLVHRIEAAGVQIRVLATIVFSVALPASFYLAFAWTAVARASTEMFAIFVFWTAAYVVTMVFLARPYREAADALEQHRIEVARLVGDVFSSHWLVRRFGGYQREQVRISESLAAEASRMRRLRLLDCLVVLFQLLLLVAFLALVTVVAARSVLAGGMTAGDFVTVFVIALGAVRQVDDIGGYLVRTLPGIPGKALKRL